MGVKDKVGQYLEYCEFRKELDSNTIKAYRIDLRQFFEVVLSDEPNKSEIETYITGLHKKYKQKTVKRKIASIKAFYNYLEDEEHIDANPFRRVKVKFKEDIVLPRIISREDIEKLLNYMYTYSISDGQIEKDEWLRDIAVLEVLFGTGARVNEISNIQLECVDLHNGSVRIMGKGGKERYVQVVDDSIMELLRDYYAANKEKIHKSGYFFVNRVGERYSEQSIRLMLKKYTKLAGIERNITPHMFRHSFATYLIEEGVDISYVKEILGHSSIKTTQIYLHIALAKQAEILRDKHPRKKMHITKVA